MLRPVSKKITLFRWVYLIVSALVFGYTAYLVADYLLYGFHNRISFNDIVNMVALVFALLFAGSIIGFIIRSFRYATLLMKNLVFKRSGEPYYVGVLIVLAGILITGCIAGLFLYSAYIQSLFPAIDPRTQTFIAAVFTMLFINLAFVDLYFLAFRHEAGTFEII